MGRRDPVARKRQRREWMARYYAKFPEKQLARKKVQTALRQGIMVKPSTCGCCAAIGPIEAHHEDYTKPLDVLWLCKRCHFSADKELKRRLENRGVEQQEARQPHKLEVAGSSPASATNVLPDRCGYAHQPVESRQDFRRAERYGQQAPAQAGFKTGLQGEHYELEP